MGPREPFVGTHPILTSLIAVLVLATSYGASGTVLSMTKMTAISPVIPANLVLSLGPSCSSLGNMPGRPSS